MPGGHFLCGMHPRLGQLGGVDTHMERGESASVSVCDFDFDFCFCFGFGFPSVSVSELYFSHKKYSP